MTIIEINAQENGAHRNQTFDFAIDIPTGWASCNPEKMENYPFGEIVKTGKVNGILTVKEWSPLPIPEAPPIDDENVSSDELFNILLGVDE